MRFSGSRILLAFLCLSLPLWAQEPPTFRLPEDVRPEHHSLELTIIPGQPGFSGHIEIDIALSQARNEIWLNSLDLEISNASIEAAGKTVAAKAFLKDDFLRLTPPARLPAGKAKLILDFSGKFDLRSTSGLFALKEGGDDYVFSQMEPSDARRAFPCFDEPHFKAPWRLRINVPLKQEIMAVSNAPAGPITAMGGAMKTFHFAETQPLPSYLVAIAVGPFDIVDAGVAGRKKTPVRIIVPRGKASQARYAAEVTAPILTELENYFDVPYPFAKLDIAALPVAFGFTAMENAGLITCRQTNMLNEHPEADPAWQQRYAGVAAHEMAHQWFGDAVSPAWWNDIWLNESFATWMERKIRASWKPEWSTTINEVSQTQGVMNADSLASARQIHQPVESRGDMAGIFDGISYQKGAAVIGMFERWAGEAEFQKGVRAYMRRYTGRAATSGDFLDSIAINSNRALTRAFATFLDQPGVPAVSVKLECRRQPTLTLSQERFVPPGSTAKAGQVWQVPVCVRYPGAGGKAQRACFLLTKASQELTLANAPACPAWVQANDGGGGYYRVRYEGGLLDSLLGTELSSAEKISLIGDLGALSRAGKVPTGDVLRLVSRFSKDPERRVVTEALDYVIGLTPIVPDSLRPQYARYLRETFGPTARRLGWLPRDGEPSDDTLLRTALVPDVALRGEDPELRAEAKRLAARWLSDHKTVPDNVARPALEIAVFDGDQMLFDEVLQQARDSQDRRQRAMLFNALGSFRNPAIVRQSFRVLLDPQIDLREALPVLYGPVGEPGVRELPLEFLKANWSAIIARSPGATDGNGFLLVPAQGFCSEEGARQAEEFFTPRMAELNAPRQLAQAVESNRLCAARKAAQGLSVETFLKAY
jgi:alanyl aminopeptidase